VLRAGQIDKNQSTIDLYDASVFPLALDGPYAMVVVA
jgi:hypothetical protein